MDETTKIKQKIESNNQVGSSAAHTPVDGKDGKRVWIQSLTKKMPWFLTKSDFHGVQAKCEMPSGRLEKLRLTK